MIIDLNEWDINYTEFAEWITNVDADVYAVSYTGGNEIGTKYLFEREEDFTAFKINIST